MSPVDHTRYIIRILTNNLAAGNPRINPVHVKTGDVPKMSPVDHIRYIILESIATYYTRGCTRDVLWAWMRLGALCRSPLEHDRNEMLL